jgi:hypothetical protein
VFAYIGGEKMKKQSRLNYIKRTRRIDKKPLIVPERKESK